MHRNKPRKTRSNTNYNELSPDPAPCLKYRKHRGYVQSVKTIGFPEYHHDVRNYYLEITYYNDNDKIPEFLTIIKACTKFTGSKDRKEQSVKEWLLSFEHSQWMTAHLWEAIISAITVTVVPKYSVGTMGMLIDDKLPGVISYIMIIAINSNLQCHFDQTDDLLVYYVKHMDVRANTLTYFTIKSGKDFNLERPKGWITELRFLPITSPKYMGMTDVMWMQVQLHYFRLLAESLSDQNEKVTSLFIETIRVLFQFISVRVRGTLTLSNEGKIKPFTFFGSPQMMNSTLNTKFRGIKELKSHEHFCKIGTSTYYLFNFDHMEEILGEENVSRDYTENGQEIFPSNMDDDVVQISYTMSLCGLLLRFCAASNKITTKHCVVRVDKNGNMFGQSLNFMNKYKSKFDEHHFKNIKCPNDENENDNQ